MDHLVVGEDGPAAIRVTKCLLLDQIDVTAEDGLQLGPHPGEVPEGPGRFQRKGDEDVHVAVWPEVVSQDRAEECELSNAPATAEVVDPVGVDEEVRGHRGYRRSGRVRLYRERQFLHLLQ